MTTPTDKPSLKPGELAAWANKLAADSVACGERDADAAMTPAAPVGDDTRLIDELRDVAQVSRVQYGTQSSSAKTCERVITRLTSQAARIAELERERDSTHEALTRAESREAHQLATMTEDADELERQLAAAQARIAELERDNKRIDDTLLRLHGELDRTHEDLERAERCIRAADVMRGTGYEPRPSVGKVQAYDAARAGITLSAESGGEGGV